MSKVSMEFKELLYKANGVAVRSDSADKDLFMVAFSQIKSGVTPAVLNKEVERMLPVVTLQRGYKRLISIAK
jgi:hypothetical protein